MWFLKLLDRLIDAIVEPIVKHFWLNERGRKP